MKRIILLVPGTVMLVLVSCIHTYELTNASANEARSITNSWPLEMRDAAFDMIDRYGQPNEITDAVISWHDELPWKSVKVFGNGVRHDFPYHHIDFIEHTINYRVPVGKYDELAKFDGSLIIDRTKGTISARCDKEEMNFLALNLAHDVITGKKTADEARDVYASTAMKFKKGQSDPYMKELRFIVSPVTLGDPDLAAGSK
jgi:hypothetical protein